jgi:enoyl-CoA hydratase/carnithine racemase
MEYKNILYRADGNLAVITLNRPHRRNSLSLELMREIISCLDDISTDRSVSAVILSAAGIAFCSGHDLSELIGRDIPGQRLIFDTCVQMMARIQTVPQPVIAQVQGIATAAGCQLVATCDLAIASDEATFATPGVKIGLFCTTPMVALSRAVGRKRALEMLLTGKSINASLAADWGLINKVVPAHQLEEATRSLATHIVDSSTLTLGIGKEAFYAQIDLDQPKAYAYAKEVMSMNAVTNDAQEGMSAFLMKRKAHWIGS